MKTKRQTFENGEQRMNKARTPYYHGSRFKVRDDSLRPHNQFNHAQDTRVDGVFVTPNINHAMTFAIGRCISGGGQRSQDNRDVYFERIATTIQPHFYVYTVYEPNDAPFTLDVRNEYYSTEPIKIAECKKYDLITEMRRLGWRVFELDEKTPSGATIDERRKWMDDAIAAGKFHCVDIEKRLKQQMGHGTLRKIFDRLIGRK